MKRLSLGVVVVAAVALLAPATASAAEYETFVGCNELAQNPVPSHVCQNDEFPGAYFESDEETEFDVCIEFPDGFFDCVEEQEAEAGILYVNSLFPDELGTYFVSWYVGGTEVGSWEFLWEAPPSPPAPPAPAPPPALAPAPPPLVIAPVKSTACLKAEKRVKQLKNQLQNAEGRKQKGKLRGKLKGARNAAKKVC